MYTLRTAADALALRTRLLPGRRLVIVGAGFVGAEVAAVARGLGVEVSCWRQARSPWRRPSASRRGRGWPGPTTTTGSGCVPESPSRVQHARGAATGVELTGGSVIDADDVLVAIGSTPNTAWLEGSGLTVRDGLVCDRFSAAAPGVYGVGDVARWHNPLFATEMRIEHRTNAAEQGLAVARNLLNPDAPARSPRCRTSGPTSTG